MEIECVALLCVLVGACLMIRGINRTTDWCDYCGKRCSVTYPVGIAKVCRECATWIGLNV